MLGLTTSLYYLLEACQLLLWQTFDVIGHRTYTDSAFSAPQNNTRLPFHGWHPTAPENQKICQKLEVSGKTLNGFQSLSITKAQPHK